MSLAAKLRRAPLRIAAGAFILNAGVAKLKADEGTAAALHGMGSAAYPVLKKVEPKVFIKAVAVGEIAVGATLLLPLVPAGLAGLVLIGFAGSLLGMYVRHSGTARQVSAPQPGRHGRCQGRVAARLGYQPGRRCRVERISDHRNRLTSPGGSAVEQHPG